MTSLATRSRQQMSDNASQTACFSWRDNMSLDVNERASDAMPKTEGFKHEKLTSVTA